MQQKLEMWPNEHHFFSEINAFINNENELWPHEHSHTFYDIMFIERGSLINRINGESVTLYKNDACIIHPEALHLVQKNGEDSVVLLHFEVNAIFFTKLIKDLGINLCEELEKDKVFYFKCSDHDSHNFMQLLTSAYSIKELEHSQTCLKNIVFKLLTKFIDSRFLNNVDMSQNSIILSFLNELKNPNNFHLSIDKICRKKSYSHEHVSRLFKQANLSTPNKIFLKNKLAYACIFLETSNMPIIKIAETCGIYTVAHFNKAFKLEYGVTPSKYRKNNKIYNKLTSYEFGKNQVII